MGNPRPSHDYGFTPLHHPPPQRGRSQIMPLHRVFSEDEIFKHFVKLGRSQNKRNNLPRPLAMPLTVYDSDGDEEFAVLTPATWSDRAANRVRGALPAGDIMAAARRLFPAQVSAAAQDGVAVPSDEGEEQESEFGGFSDDGDAPLSEDGAASQSEDDAAALFDLGRRVTLETHTGSALDEMLGDAIGVSAAAPFLSPFCASRS
jgi:hypothetical protein